MKQPLPAESVAPRVLVINFDPPVPSLDGKPLHEALHWNDPHALAEGYAADLAECSAGYLRYRVVEWLDSDEFPVKRDGFRYTAESYLACRNKVEPWHLPDLVDYLRIFQAYRIPERIERDEIDEVWLFGFPYAGFWESTMGGIGAYFCNSKPVPGVWTARIFVTMGFSYERGVGEMLENFGHRGESIMRRVFGSWEHRPTHDWNRFTLYEQVAPGQSGCGWMHYAPSSERDYEWGNPRTVWSSCDDWLDYPRLAGKRRQVSRAEWGGGEIRAHHRWWLQHLPRAEGRTRGKLNNWWAYMADFNRFPESRGG